MKHLTFLTFLISLCSFSQQWQTIPNEHYHVFKYTSGGNTTPSGNYSQFELNPYDGSMWFISNHTDSNFNIKRIQDGMLTLFTPSNMAYMDMNSRSFYGIGFSSNKTYLLHRFDGAFSFDGINWTYEETFDKGISVCSDGDTVYFGRENESFVRLTETGATYNWAASTRLAVRNGVAWSSYGFYDGIQKLNSTFDNAVFYDPISSDYLLDNSNYDFKFARNSDTLYVAGDLGFSLAYGDVFVDTITMNTAPSMPYPTIVEFEFDSQDNIWAVFGNDYSFGPQAFIPLYIGYYDRSVQDWTLIYDQSNCPVDFTERLDIEIDADDNLWVCDNFDLHVLKVNNAPSWLSLIEEKNEQFSVFPNPSNGVISIQTDAAVSYIEIRDLTGRLIRTMTFSPEIQIDEKGTYLIRLLDKEHLVIGTRTIVIE